MTNSIDWIIYNGLFFFTITALVLISKIQPIKQKFYEIIISLTIVICSSLLFAFPFVISFKPFVKGIERIKTNSTLLELSVLWGFYFIVAMLFFVLLSYVYLKHRKQDTDIIGGARKIDIFVLVLIFIAAGLIIFPEVFYFKDIYYATHHRANTMFKLVYQAWVMLGIATGYIFVRGIIYIKNKFALIWISFFIFLFSVVMVYPYLATNTYYNKLKEYKGLWGLIWLKNMYPDDLAGINWLNENIKNQPVIIEAVGDDYTFYGRVSANTGLINIVNWPVHEWLWRGSYDEAGKRKEEVRQIYESADIQRIKSLLKNYDADYIFLGTLEREKYPSLNENNFKELGSIVFENGQTKIYKIDKNILSQ